MESKDLQPPPGSVLEEFDRLGYMSCHSKSADVSVGLTRARDIDSFASYRMSEA